TLALSAPEILKTISNPIDSLKSPLKTLGSFIGLSEHPADLEKNGSELLNEDSPIKNNDDIDESIANTEEGNSLSSIIAGLGKSIYKLSPMYMISYLGNESSYVVVYMYSETIVRET